MAWVIGHEKTYSDLSSEKHIRLSFDEGEVGFIEVTFAYSGSLRVYTDGEDTDTVGFLSTSSNFKTDTGRPYPESSILAESDDDGDGSNFDFTCEVEADTTYYIWYRFYNDVMSGSIPLHILPPAEEDLYEPDDSGAELDITADGTSIRARITGLDEEYDGIRKAVWDFWYRDADNNKIYLFDDPYEIYSDDNDFLGSFDDITLSENEGIQPDTLYYITVSVYCYPDTDAQKITVVLSGTVSTPGTPSPERPAKFTWADGSTTKTAGKPFDITAAEWCDLLDNFKAVLEYKGYAIPSSGTGVAQFYYPSQGDEFSAWICNQVLYQLYMLGAADYKPVSSGDSVTAARINEIVELLNSID